MLPICLEAPISVLFFHLFALFMNDIENLVICINCICNVLFVLKIRINVRVDYLVLLKKNYSDTC